jgi:hypothetical protein
VSINKLNLRLVRAKEYLSKFPLLIRHKLSKANFILNTLFKLPTIDNLKPEAINSKVRISLTKKELNALFACNAFIDKIARSKVYNEFNKYYIFAATFIKIAPDFKEKFI